MTTNEYDYNIQQMPNKWKQMERQMYPLNTNKLSSQQHCNNNSITRETVWSYSPASNVSLFFSNKNINNTDICYLKSRIKSYLQVHFYPATFIFILQIKHQENSHSREQQSYSRSYRSILGVHYGVTLPFYDYSSCHSTRE